MAEPTSRSGESHPFPYQEPEVTAPQYGEDLPPKPQRRSKRTWFKDGIGGERKGRVVGVIVIACVATLAVITLINSTPKRRRPSAVNQQTRQAPVRKTESVGLPTDRVEPVATNDEQDEISPETIQKAAQSAQNVQSKADLLSSSLGDHARPNEAAKRQSLGEIPAFTPPPIPGDGNNQWTPAPYHDAAMNQNRQREIESAHRAALTRASLTFVDEKEDSHPSSGQAGAVASHDDNWNLGFRAGYHLSTHLETVASTFLAGAPVIAVVDFDYSRNGATIVPAGSRVIGSMGGANATGLCRINFTSITMPNGATVPISAIGLDHHLMPLKGYVTGRHRFEQFFLAGLAGTGNVAAIWSSSSGSLSEADLLKLQAANSFGAAAGQQISDLQEEVQKNLVVTLPAGTQVEVLFTDQQRNSGSGKSQQ